jgi:hypothetical protein
MSLELLTPLAALVALGGVLPLIATAVSARRADRARRELGLEPRGRSRLPVAAVLVGATLLGLAAAQPILEQKTRLAVRSDAEAYVVVDISRSMLARRDTESAPRIERAKAAAIALRGQLQGVRVGLASLTDRVLPHLFPSPSEDVFAATLHGAVGIERPPPQGVLSTNATTLEALKVIPRRRFFSRAAEHRLLVVLTDGETRQVNESAVRASLRRTPAVETVFVQFWHERELVFSGGAPEPDYEPDPTARAALERLAEATRGAVYSEQEVGAAGRASVERLGEGPTVAAEERRRRWALAPFLAAAAFVPLGLLLGRRER